MIIYSRKRKFYFSFEAYLCIILLSGNKHYAEWLTKRKERTGKKREKTSIEFNRLNVSVKFFFLLIATLFNNLLYNERNVVEFKNRRLSHGILIGLLVLFSNGFSETGNPQQTCFCV